jgi:hypothetical protein
VFFWIGILAVALVIAVGWSWGAHGMKKREHKPGTQRLR